jgi:4-hydroxy-tetrahydrodipicolinate reductase
MEGHVDGIETIILGDGGFGRAIAAALRDRRGPEPRLFGRPGADGHRLDRLAGGAVAFDASEGAAVVANTTALLAAGCRRIVIGTTGWDADRALVDAALREHGAAAVAASNFSLGVAMFGRLVDRAIELFGPLEAFDPYLVEWHRRSKADRPSGTALGLAHRVLNGHPRKSRIAERRDAPPADDELEVAVVRAGASPGVHVLGFDAPGETVELRHTARDRSTFATGALAAAEWLLADRRPAGLHGFDEVVDDVLERTDREAPMPLAV